MAVKFDRASAATAGMPGAGLAENPVKDAVGSATEDVAEQAAPGPADAEDHDTQIGAAIREHRLARGLTLREVAMSAGVSIGMVSQIERGLSSPSLRTLREVCAVIGLPMQRLFEDPRGPGDETVVRTTERRQLVLDEKGMKKELLTRREEGLQAMIVTIRPGGGSGDDPYSHDGEEVGHVLSGTLEITIGEATYTLTAGDTFSFASPLPHKFRNTGPQDTAIMWVVSKPFY